MVVLDRLVGWLVGKWKVCWVGCGLFVCLVCWWFGWLWGWFFVQRFGGCWLVGWLVSCLVGWRDGRSLVGGSVGLSFIQPFGSFFLMFVGHLCGRVFRLVGRSPGLVVCLVGLSLV